MFSSKTLLNPRKMREKTVKTMHSLSIKAYISDHWFRNDGTVINLRFYEIKASVADTSSENR